MSAGRPTVESSRTCLTESRPFRAQGNNISESNLHPHYFGDENSTKDNKGIHMCQPYICQAGPEPCASIDHAYHKWVPASTDSGCVPFRGNRNSSGWRAARKKGTCTPRVTIEAVVCVSCTSCVCDEQILGNTSDHLQTPKYKMMPVISDTCCILACSTANGDHNAPSL